MMGLFDGEDWRPRDLSWIYFVTIPVSARPTDRDRQKCSM